MNVSPGRGDAVNAVHSAPPCLSVAYGSTYGRTEEIAERVAERLRAVLRAEVPCLDVADTPPERWTAARVLLLGSSTWNVGELQDDWVFAIEELRAADLHGKHVAVFGAGDMLAYPDTFGDAVGMLAQAAEEAGARLIGLHNEDATTGVASRARRDGRWLGLVADLENDPDGAPACIDRWADLVAAEARAVCATERGH